MTLFKTNMHFHIRRHLVRWGALIVTINPMIFHILKCRTCLPCDRRLAVRGQIDSVCDLMAKSNSVDYFCVFRDSWKLG